MLQDVEFKEMDFFRDYLRGHLRDHFFPQYTNEKFIEQRAGEAYDTLVSLTLEGRSNTVAHELAMRTLLAGLYVSRYDILYSIIEENLWKELSEDVWVKCAEHFLTFPEVHEILDRYAVNGDFLERETHKPMLMELLAFITETLDGYGFQ